MLAAFFRHHAGMMNPFSQPQRGVPSSLGVMPRKIDMILFSSPESGGHIPPITLRISARSWGRPYRASEELGHGLFPGALPLAFLGRPVEADYTRT